MGMVRREMGVTGGRPSVEMLPELEAVWTGGMVTVVGVVVPLMLGVGRLVSSNQGYLAVEVEGEVTRPWRDIGRADGGRG